MQQIYYKDDFRIAVTFMRDGEAAPMPDVDFAGVLKTPGSLATSFVRFGRRDGVLKACEVDEAGVLHIAADGHSLSPGVIDLEIAFFVPNADYPDGTQRIGRRFTLDACLSVRPSDSCGCGCPPADAVARIEIPWQYVHDTDVYNEVLVKVNDLLGAILNDPDQQPVIEATKAPARRRGPYRRNGLLNLRNDTGDIYTLGLTHYTRQLCVKYYCKKGEVVELKKYFLEEDYRSLGDVWFLPDDNNHAVFLPVEDSTTYRVICPDNGRLLIEYIPYPLDDEIYMYPCRMVNGKFQLFCTGDEKTFKREYMTPPSTIGFRRNCGYYEWPKNIRLQKLKKNSRRASGSSEQFTFNTESLRRRRWCARQNRKPIKNPCGVYRAQYVTSRGKSEWAYFSVCVKNGKIVEKRI